METEEPLIYSDNGLVFKRETIVKRRRLDEKRSEEKAKQRLNRALEKTKHKKRDIIKHPEKFIMEYREKQKNYETSKHRVFKKKNLVKATNCFHLICNFIKTQKMKEISKDLKDHENAVCLIIRIKGSKNVPLGMQKSLQKIGLKKNHEARFVKLTKSVMRMITNVETFVTYGFPSKKLMTDLIKKRGFLRIKNEKIPCTSNAQIEEMLGSQGIICQEDIVYEFIKGDKLRMLNQHMWQNPKISISLLLLLLGFVRILRRIKYYEIQNTHRPFCLEVPKDTFVNRKKKYGAGGEWGYRGNDINKLLEKMI